jgi:hypothetical protein
VTPSTQDHKAQGCRLCAFLLVLSKGRNPHFEIQKKQSVDLAEELRGATALRNSGAFKT